MNFFGHSVCAAAIDADPRFGLGAMIPDLVGMAAVSPPEGPSPVLEGVRLHHRTDAVFHDSPTFERLCAQGRRELIAQGVRRGPALAVSHVAVELVLDGALSRDALRVRAFEAALDEARSLRWTASSDGERFAALCDRLRRSALPIAYRDPQEAAARIVGALVRRPRLRLSFSEADVVYAWLAALRPRVEGVAESWLAELCAAL